MAFILVSQDNAWSDARTFNRKHRINSVFEGLGARFIDWIGSKLQKAGYEALELNAYKENVASHCVHIMTKLTSYQWVLLQDIKQNFSFFIDYVTPSISIASPKVDQRF
jgi:hypothetical protein